MNPVLTSLTRALVTDPARMAAGLWSRRELVAQFTRRNIEIRHRGSRLGAFWALINPLSMLALYFVVFGVIYDQRFGVLPDETRYDFSLALFLGLALFHAFSETLTASPALITANPNFVKKVVFPLEVLPAAQIGATAFHLAVSLALVLLGSVFGETVRPSLHMLWLPALIVPLLVFSLGIAWLLSALGVFLRDIGQITAFLATALLFASAVMYPPSKIPPELGFLKYNPLFQVVDLARRTVLWQQPMPMDQLTYVYMCSLTAFVVGAVFFAVLRRSFAEVL